MDTDAPSLYDAGVESVTTYLQLDGLGELALLAHDLGVTLFVGFTLRVGEDLLHSLGYKVAVQLAAHLRQDGCSGRARTEQQQRHRIRRLNRPVSFSNAKKLSLYSPRCLLLLHSTCIA